MKSSIVASIFDLVEADNPFVLFSSCCELFKVVESFNEFSNELPFFGFSFRCFFSGSGSPLANAFNCFFVNFLPGDILTLFGCSKLLADCDGNGGGGATAIVDTGC